MKIATWTELAEGRATVVEPGEAAWLSIGFFDGVHIGHRRLLQSITGGPAGRRLAEPPDAAPPARGSARGVVVTFRRKPVVTAAAPALILTLAQKLRRLESLGVGGLVLIDFSDDFSTLPGRAFIESLRERLAIEKITVGPNFRFGRNRDADVHALGAMLGGSGTSLEVVDPVMHDGRIVSSSRIRAAIRDGAFGEAREMLAADHEIDLEGVEAVREGPGALRINRITVTQVLPASGGYRVRGRWSGGEVPGRMTIAGEAVALVLERDVPVRSLAFVGRE